MDVGVSLHVTPVINKQGYVKLHIKPEVSSVRDWLETSEGNNIPIVETSNVETDILVKDGQTIIMAGLIKETEEKEENKLPILGDIPFLGNSVKNVKKEKERKELIILITPSVITGMSEKYNESIQKDKQRAIEKENIKQEIEEEKRKNKMRKKEEFKEKALKEEELKEKELKEKGLKEEESKEKELKEKGLKEKESKEKTKKPAKRPVEVKKETSGKKDLFKQYRELGLAGKREKNYSKAIKAYKKALEINPNSAIIHLYLADIYSNYAVDVQKAKWHFKWYKVLKTLSTLEDNFDQKK
jgi:tetratricopeptide (TPR) repeat protein